MQGRFVLGGQFNAPSGLAWANDVLFVANHDSVWAWPYRLGDTAFAGQPTKIMDLAPGPNHWMRNLLLSPDAIDRSRPVVVRVNGQLRPLTTDIRLDHEALVTMAATIMSCTRTNCARLATGPCVVCGRRGSPTLRPG